MPIGDPPTTVTELLVKVAKTASRMEQTRKAMADIAATAAVVRQQQAGEGVKQQ
jgi:hypothetical protein